MTAHAASCFYDELLSSNARQRRQYCRQKLYSLYLGGTYLFINDNFVCEKENC